MMTRFLSRLGPVVVSLALLAGCKEPPPPPPPGVPTAEHEKVKQENAQLKETLGQKTEVLNQLQEELTVLTSTGEMMMKARKDIESGTTTKEQSQVLKDNVEKARKLLDDREKRIKELQSRLKSSEEQVVKMVDLITKLMLERQTEIAQLESEIDKLRKEKGIVETERDEARKQREEEATKRAQAEQELDTVYVAIGTEQQLRAAKILNVEKGALGLSKKVKVAARETWEGFQKLSASKDTEIALGTLKSFEFATGHDPKLCQAEKRGTETFLKVTDPKAFWRDKALVIVVKR